MSITGDGRNDEHHCGPSQEGTGGSAADPSQAPDDDLADEQLKQGEAAIVLMLEHRRQMSPYVFELSNRMVDGLLFILGNTKLKIGEYEKLQRIAVDRGDKLINANFEIASLRAKLAETQAKHTANHDAWLDEVVRLKAQLAEQATLLNPNAGHPPVPASQHPPTADLMAMAEKVAKRHLLTEQEIIDGGVAFVMGDDAITPNAEGQQSTGAASPSAAGRETAVSGETGLAEQEIGDRGNTAEGQTPFSQGTAPCAVSSRLVTNPASPHPNAEGPSAEEVHSACEWLRDVCVPPLSESDTRNPQIADLIERLAAQVAAAQTKGPA